MHLFGLPLEGADAVDLDISLKSGEAILSVEGIPPVTIKHGMIPETPLALDRFEIFPCFTGATSAAEVMTLRFRSGGQRDTFGFVFPTTSFRNEPGFEEKFLLIYADAAFKGIMTPEYLSEFQAKVNWGDISESPSEMDEVLVEDLSLLAVSKEVMEKHGIDRSLLDLILRKHCISICSSAAELKLCPAIPSFREALNFSAPKIDNQDDLQILSMLLRNADRDNSEVGKFIQLYQFFEYMLKMVFEWGIPEAAKEGLSAWDVRERLTNLGKEKNRLHLIHTVCTPNIQDRQSQVDIKEACKKFLALVSTDFKENQPWYRLLYKVRNCVVHNQFSMLNPECATELGILNMALRMVALDMLFHFEKPGPDQLFPTDENPDG